MLAGNVAYTLIEVNVRELLEPAADNQGWSRDFLVDLRRR